MTPTMFLGLALTPGAPALKEKDAPAPLAGDWVIVECTVGGKPSPPGTTPNRWAFRADGDRPFRGTATGMVTGAVPPNGLVIDYTRPQGPWKKPVMRKSASPSVHWRRISPAAASSVPNAGGGKKSNGRKRRNRSSNG